MIHLFSTRGKPDGRAGKTSDLRCGNITQGFESWSGTGKILGDPVPLKFPVKTPINTIPFRMLFN